MFVCCECCVLLRRIDNLTREVLPTVAGRCVWSRNLENEEDKARYRALRIQPQRVVTPGKQTSEYYVGRVFFFRCVCKITKSAY